MAKHPKKMQIEPRGMPQIAFSPPILQALKPAKNVLIAGAGGGYDCYLGLPLYHSLKEAGKEVYFASYSFTDFTKATSIKNHTDIEVAIDKYLIGISSKHSGGIPFYFSELPFAFYLQQRLSYPHPVWLFAKTGVIPLRYSYQHLIDKYKIDAIVLVDGGVDSLMMGNEEGGGTFLEDTVSLAAIYPLSVPLKILACVGFGTESEEQLCHFHALQNMSNLVGQDYSAFLGCCSLLPQQLECRMLSEAYSSAIDDWMQPHSHIVPKILGAIHGYFGQNYSTHKGKEPLCHSLLMSLYWFFQSDVVTSNSYIAASLEKSVTFTDVQLIYRSLLYDGTLKIRKRQTLPY
jgi:hypothetical protein